MFHNSLCLMLLLGFCQSLSKRYTICSKFTINIVKKYKTAQKCCNSAIYKLKTFIISLAKNLLSTVTAFITNKQQFAQISSRRDLLFAKQKSEEQNPLFLCRRKLHCLVVVLFSV